MSFEQHPMIDVDGEKKHRHNSDNKPIHHTDEGIRNFHRWFGDSKVVDEHGRPSVVYHGTEADFPEFSREKIGSANWMTRPGSGFYFAKDTTLPSRYAQRGSANVMPVYVRINHPTNDISQINSTGVDGFINSRMVVARDPSQIKSAIGNKGSFSMKSNKLVESVQLLSFNDFLAEGFDFKPAGHSESETPKHPISEIIKSTRLNVAYKTAKKFNPNYNLHQQHPESNLLKQYVIGKTMELAQAGSPEYKEAVFNGYKEHSPSSVGRASNYDEFVNNSYARLAKDTNRQFDALPVKLHYHDGEADYTSSGEMVKDVHHNRNLNVFRGGDPHSHDVTDPKTGITLNQKFRAVHDFFGHAIHNTQFGPKGEEAAWNSHRQMYSELAVPTVTAETRGQNSQVNYTPMNLKNLIGMKYHRAEAEKAKKAGDSVLENHHRDQVKQIGRNWNYAPQKGVVLPHEMNSPDFKGDVPKSVKRLLKDPLSERTSTYDSKADHLGIVGLAKHYHPDNWHAVATTLSKIHGFKSVDKQNLSESVDDLGLHDVSAEDVKGLEVSLKTKYPELHGLNLYDRGEDIRLDHIAVKKEHRNAGIGGKVINEIKDYADKHNKRITLTAGVRDPHFGTTSQSRLDKFYRSHGFVANKGRNKDYSISATHYYVGK